MKTRPLKILTASLLLNLAIPVLPTHAGPGDVDLSFDPGAGIDGAVSSVAVQSDGKVIIGGRFRTVKGLVRLRLARLNADGTGDASFNPDSEVTSSPLPNQVDPSVFLQRDGKVLVAGDFTTSNGTARSLFVRLNADGSHDASFVAAISGGVRAVALQPDGKVVIIGSFTTNGTNSLIAARLNSNGSLDNSFTPATGIFVTSSATVISVAIQVDGKVLIGGIFRSINGTAREGIARLNANGTVDTTFNPDPSSVTRRVVRSIAVQTDGKVLISGYTRAVSNNEIKLVVRLNADGSVDSSFNAGTIPNGEVFSLALQPDGKMVIAGGVMTGVGRLNANGGLDSSFNPGTGPDYVPGVVALQPDGKVLIGGYFNTVNGLLRIALARLDGNGTLDTSFNPGAGVFSDFNSAVVYALATQADGKVVIGGFINTVAGTSRNGVARLNADGSLDNSFNPGTGANASVRALAVQPDGKVVIGGGFTIVDGTARNFVARLNTNGTLDSSFNPGAGPDNVVFAVALQSDGKVLIGGWFTTVDGPARNKIARLNSDGSLDTTFGNTGTGESGNVYSIALQPDGKVLRGGDYIARLHTNGTLDGTFDPGTGVGSSIESVVLQPDGKVLMGGYFSTVNGTAHTGLARLQAAGTIDAGFNPGTIAGGNSQNGTSVNSMTLQPDGKVLIGGSFTNVNSKRCNNIARLNPDGSLDNSFNPGNGANGALVYSMALQSDGELLIGGDFTVFNSAPRWRVARLLGDLWLATVRSGPNVVLSWPTNAAGYTVQSATNLVAPVAWVDSTDVPVAVGTQFTITNTTSASRQFFRLKR